MDKRVVAVVLAAGKSQRMGRFKQLLPFGGRAVVQTVVDMLHSLEIEEIVVVVGHRADEVRKVLADSARCVENPGYADGMFSSVLAGLNALDPKVDGMMLLLGDQPQIRVSVVKTVLDRFCSTGKGIVLPEVLGKRGHPVIIDVQRYGEAIRALDGSEGLKPLVRGYPEDTEIVKIDDESILRDLDTPEDYERELRLRE